MLDRILRVERIDLLRQLHGEEAVGGSHRRVHPAEPGQCHRAQAAAHRIAHDQRADERRAPHRRAQHHAEMGAGVEAQAAQNEGAESHVGNDQ